MIDKETGMVPVFDKLMGTCKRWVSSFKKIGVPKHVKNHCRGQFQSLTKTWMEGEEAQISYADMKAAGLPLGEHSVYVYQTYHSQN